MFGSGDTNYGKKAYKNNVHAGGYYTHHLGPGKKDERPQ
jgi:hypothetical protein